MLFNQKTKRFLCTALLSATVFGVATSFTGCTTSHPEVEMKIKFNDKAYVMQYTLYRKLAPATVQHFMDLAELEFYNGLCVHDYTDGKIYAGGYKYDAEESDQGGLVEVDYFATVAERISKKGKDAFSHSVWHDREKTTPTYTVYGEFSNNNFEVESGALKQSFGSLTMFYTPKTNNRDEVYAARSDGDGVNRKDYRYNSATSLFFISTSTSTTSSSSYCTFATIKDDSKDDLNNLLDAIADYIDEHFEEEAEEFAPDTVVSTDLGDEYVGDDKLTDLFNVPVEPIVIEYVKVKKY